MTQLKSDTPSEQSLKKAREIISGAFVCSLSGSLGEDIKRVTEVQIERVAAALDAAKAERTEECAGIADKHRCALDNEWNRSLGAAGSGLAEVAEDIACEIRSLSKGSSHEG